MANHPLNLALRFFLELVGLFALGYWGWTQHSGLLRFLLAAGLPLAAAVLWGVFRVPNDPGQAPVAVPGVVRLLLEAAYFSAAVWALYAAGRLGWGLTLAVVVLLHYALSYDRVLRMLRG
ncbi:MAG: YrdB family protein [Chloroflexi bacterium]|nr:YrdB family protein [Chloroflexota bacterium]